MTKLFAVVATTTDDYLFNTSVLGIYTDKEQAEVAFDTAIDKARDAYEDALAQVESGNYVLEESADEWQLYKDGSLAEDSITIKVCVVEQNKPITNL